MCSRFSKKTLSAPTRRAAIPRCARMVSAASISFLVLAFRICSCSPRTRAAVWAYFVSVSATIGLVGLTSSAISVAVGTSSCSGSSRFGTSSAFHRVTPVRLPPGRFQLATRPSSTGSPAVPNTIGIVVVAVLAANAPEVLPAIVSPTPVDEPDQLPIPAADGNDSPPNEIQLLHCGPQHSPFRSGLGGTYADDLYTDQVKRRRGTQSQASPAVARVPRAATPPRR